MEYAEDDSFTDNASLIIINRNLPVPVFTVAYTGGWLVINTPHLALRYKENSGRFTNSNLEIDFIDDNSAVGKVSIPQNNFAWKPGTKDHANIKGIRKDNQLILATCVIA